MHDCKQVHRMDVGGIKTYQPMIRVAEWIMSLGYLDVATVMKTLTSFLSSSQ